MKSIKDMFIFLDRDNPNRVIAFGYLSYVVLGAFILCLPFFKKIPSISFLDNLFTAASAVSTTGLTTISVSDSYTFWGQLVVTILIQLGGIGYMTLGSFIMMSITGRMGIERTKIQKNVFNLADHITAKEIVKAIIYYSFVVEIAGAILLYIFFRVEGLPDAFWSAIFHSVSAFCTAGFSLYNNSLESFGGHWGINLVISILCILGSVGFIIVHDVWHCKIKEKRQISLTSKIIIRSTFILIAAGWVLLFFFEPEIIKRAFFERVLVSFFQSMTALTTAGFNTIPFSGLTMFSYFLITILMVIGASPTGTGGGLKTTTFTALLGVMKSTLMGESEVKYLNRTIPPERIWVAVSSLCFYLLVLLFSILFMLLQSGSFGFQQIVFEVASALGTVGLSTGITAQLNSIEKTIIIITMVIGRIGPLSFGIALFLGKDAGLIRYPEEDLAL